MLINSSIVSFSLFENPFQNFYKHRKKMFEWKLILETFFIHPSLLLSSFFFLYLSTSSFVCLNCICLSVTPLVPNLFTVFVSLFDYQAVLGFFLSCEFVSITFSFENCFFLSFIELSLKSIDFNHWMQMCGKYSLLTWWKSNKGENWKVKIFI